ncbi:MAG: DUF2848 domain-containing protein [Geminicoccaceae bacterium]|nr:DUF2848 domain-containing protein [Geminicoccaceae bacterium]
MPSFERHTKAARDRIGIEPEVLVMAGWTGRDPAAVEAHKRELAELGVAPPSAVPMFYRMEPGLLTTASRIQVLGSDTSGEVEAVLVALADGLWVGLGSDHTDRKFEAVSLPLSKQLCRKVMAGELWRFDEVAGHWDDLHLRAWIEEDGERVLYQDGALGTVRRPGDLIRSFASGADRLPPMTLMFMGALNAIGPVRPSARFEMELSDPVLGRTIGHAYDVDVLPLAS